MKYRCKECKTVYSRWVGKCPSCGTWDSLQEVEEDSNDNKKSSLSRKKLKTQNIHKFNDSEQDGKTLKGRIKSSFSELDRVLGGGLVRGEVVLMSGEPGIGKSTLLLQIAINLSKGFKVAYISGEESYEQVKGRVRRFLGKKDIKDLDNLYFLDEIVIEKINNFLRDEKPDLVIVDSIQAVKSLDHDGYVGSIGQVKICGNRLITTAKKYGIPTILVGQITKSGNIAGPKVLEHMVDAVLYFEGDRNNYFRILRSVKNRFGSTDEIGVFEMKSEGLVEVENPSNAFLAGGEASIGSAIGAVVKGSRVVFVEIQALTVDKNFEGVPLRRVANGIKKSKLDMICAVLSRRGGVFLGDKDVFVNVSGGISIDEPAIDLAICAAIKSAVEDKVVKKGSAFIGEVGLTGVVRGGWGTDKIVKEASRIGYKNIFVGDGDLSKKDDGLIYLKFIKDLSL